MAQPRRLNAGAVSYVFVMEHRELRSEFAAAVGAEQRAGLVALASATAAADLEGQRRPARRAELPAPRLPAAPRAGHLRPGVEVQVGRPVLVPGLVPDLVALRRRLRA